jgi:hypothetical protein
MKTGKIFAAVFLALFMTTAPLWAQDETELAKKVQNPIASLISVPFQDNINFGYGPDNEVQNVLNIQPVIPFSLSSDWNLITRTIIPVIYTPWPEDKFGLGDVNLSLFFSPAKPSKFIWGVGPVLGFPTATDKLLGPRKWTAGPTAVGLYMTGPWVVGALANNQWSYAGSGSEDVNLTLIQPFINYNLPKGWYLSASPIMTANWKADKDGDVWTVPLGAGVGKIFKIGKQPMNAQMGAYYNVAKPEIGPDWTLRLQLQFLFPK